jgi:hypothetical protein
MKNPNLSRAAIADMLAGKIGRLDQWLAEVYETHGAYAAFKCYVSILEFHMPKLSRVSFIKYKEPEEWKEPINIEQARQAYLKLIKR